MQGAQQSLGRKTEWGRAERACCGTNAHTRPYTASQPVRGLGSWGHCGRVAICEEQEEVPLWHQGPLQRPQPAKGSQWHPPNVLL